MVAFEDADMLVATSTSWPVCLGLVQIVWIRSYLHKCSGTLHTPYKPNQPFPAKKSLKLLFEKCFILMFKCTVVNFAFVIMLNE